MKISKRDFFRLLGAGAAAVPVTRAHTESRTPELQAVPRAAVSQPYESLTARHTGVEGVEARPIQ